MPGDIYLKYDQHLSGKRLDTSHRFHNPASSVVDRAKYLRERCRGKKVLHIGCLDHPEIILRKKKSETWLHAIISETANVCLGLDNNIRAYDIARNQLGITNVELLDLGRPLPRESASRLRDLQWDIILCAEVLEHVTNHDLFLQNLHCLANADTSLLITGPNAFRIHNFVNAVRGFESVNSDHKYWFTFYTLSRLLAAHGWKARRILYYATRTKRQPWTRTVANLAMRLSPALGDGLIMEATYSNE